jgi:carboxyl-terminal processing protease
VTAASPAERYSVPVQWSQRSRLLALAGAGIILIAGAGSIGPARAYRERRYLDAALQVIEQHSVRAHVTNWAMVRRQARDRLAASGHRVDTYDAIRTALRAAGDQHSGVIEPAMVARLGAITASDGPQPSGELLPGRSGYLRVRGFAATSAAASSEGATRLQHFVQAVERGEPCGWMIDLRTNTGGNMWPMLAGLGALLGDGDVGAFVFPDGTRAVWSYDAGAAMESGKIRARVSGAAYEPGNQALPLAILIGPQTASSGEAVAVAFRGRPDVLTFGQRSRGLSTSNNPFRLGDGALLNLSVAVFADRQGREYADGVEPDQATSPG